MFCNDIESMLKSLRLRGCDKLSGQRGGGELEIYGRLNLVADYENSG